MRLLLFEDVPLRTTRILGDFAEDTPLPHRLGNLTDARFKLIRLSDTEFFAADHPMEINGAFVADQRTDAWQRELVADPVVEAYTIVRLATPAPKDAVVSATGTGRRDKRTGKLIENPAEAMEYVLRLAGRSDVFVDLRAEASAAAINVAGSITEIKSIRAQLDEIARSVAAIWTPTQSRLYPTTVVAGPVTELNVDSAWDIRPVAELQDTADVLQIGYGEENATGKSLRSIELTANPKRYGGIVAQRTLAWLRSPANAESVGRRILSRLAGERYTVQFSSDRTDLRPGRWVRLVDHPEWPTAAVDPQMMVLAVDVTPFTRAIEVTAEAILSYPSITVTAHSIALPSTTQGPIEVSFRDGIATFTIKDPEGRPLAGARVALDGSAAKRTDSQGRVAFHTSGGHHSLAIAAPGFLSETIEFDL